MSWTPVRHAAEHPPPDVPRQDGGVPANRLHGHTSPRHTLLGKSERPERVGL
jgi:hypothetical protein